MRTFLLWGAIVVFAVAAALGYRIDQAKVDEIAAEACRTARGAQKAECDRNVASPLLLERRARHG